MIGFVDSSDEKPIVTVIIAGRPYAILKIAEQTDGLLYSFYPGPYGGLALAKLIYGEESPSGRLPISIPAHVGQLPVYYNPKRSYEAMKYCDEADRPLYEFGEGFGYGQLSYEKTELRENRRWWCDGYGHSNKFGRQIRLGGSTDLSE